MAEGGGGHSSSISPQLQIGPNLGICYCLIKWMIYWCLIFHQGQSMSISSIMPLSLTGNLCYGNTGSHKKNKYKVHPLNKTLYYCIWLSNTWLCYRVVRNCFGDTGPLGPKSTLVLWIYFFSLRRPKMSKLLETFVDLSLQIW